MDQNLLQQINTAISTDSRLESLNRPEAWNDQNRRSTYQNLAETALGYSKANETLNTTLGMLYVREPEFKMAVAIYQSAAAAVREVESQTCPTPSQLRTAMLANQLAGSIILATQRSAPTVQPRKQKAIHETLDWLASESAPAPAKSLAQLNELNQKRLIQRCWHRVVNTWFSQLRQVSTLLPELEKWTGDSDNPAIQQSRTEILHQLLDQPDLDWRQIRSSIKKAIATSDDTALDRWVQRISTSQNALNDFISIELAKALQLDPNLPFDSRVRELRKIRSANRMRGFSVEVESSAVVEDSIRQIRNELESLGFDNAPEKLPADSVPQLLLKLAACNNIALNWHRSVQERSFRSLAREHSRAERLTILPTPNAPVIRSAPTAFEKRKLEESIQRISDSDAAQTSTRVTALRAMVSVAPRFEDINYRDAEKLARYILSPSNQREVLEIERALPNFENWFNLKLALVDQFSITPDLSIDSFIQHLNRLGTQVAVDSTERQQLPSRIIALVAEELNQRYKSNIITNQWAKAGPRFSELIGQRTKILGASNQPTRQFNANAVVRGIERFSGEPPNEDDATSRMLTLIAESDHSELEKMVQANLVFCRLIQPSESRRNSIHQDWMSTLRTNPNLNQGHRLLISELLLMDSLQQSRISWLTEAADQ